MSGNKWIMNPKNIQEAEYKLFCIPYAGGGATVFREWQKQFGDKLCVCPIQLPGRESRMSEPLVSDIHTLADMIYDGIKDQLDCRFSIFGHSMGGMIAYEVTRRIMDNSDKAPEILFLSGTSLTRRKKKIPVSHLDDEMLFNYLINLGGIEPGLFQNDTIKKMYMDSYVPIIKNDYTLIEQYTCEPYKLSCRVTAFAGRDDGEISDIESREIEWFAEHFTIRFFDGGHFFINDSIRDVCAEIIREVGI